MKLTMSQALVRFLKNQFVERDDKKNAFFSGVWGIFGHGNVAGIGQALEQDGELKHFLPRNEQAMVHVAAEQTLKNICLHLIYWTRGNQHDYWCCRGNNKSLTCIVTSW